MNLPIFKSMDQNFMLMQNKWSSILNILLGNTLVQGNLLSGVDLANGVTVINHKLGRMMRGWLIADIDSGASIYRSSPMNDKTLTLTSNAIATVNLWVF